MNGALTQILSCQTYTDLNLETVWLTLPVPQWAATYICREHILKSEPLSPIPENKPLVPILKSKPHTHIPKSKPLIPIPKSKPLHVQFTCIHVYMSFIQPQYEDLTS